jgi:hypothetical protein
MAEVDGSAGTSDPLFPDRKRGVWGESDDGYGVAGTASSGNGVQAGSISGFGLVGTSETSIGIFGISQVNIGVYGRSGSSDAVFDTGEANPTKHAPPAGLNYGVIGSGGGSGVGVYGYGADGIFGYSTIPQGAGVSGSNDAPHGGKSSNSTPNNYQSDSGEPPSPEFSAMNCGRAGKWLRRGRTKNAQFDNSYANFSCSS